VYIIDCGNILPAKNKIKTTPPLMEKLLKELANDRKRPNSMPTKIHRLIQKLRSIVLSG
jgi:hypothetical protein